MYSGARGPGTLVTTVWSSGCGSSEAARDPRASQQGPGEAQHPGEDLRADGLVGALEAVHLLADQRQPPQRVRLADGQVDQHRGHPVGDCPCSSRRCGPRPAPGCARPGPSVSSPRDGQQVTEGPGDHGQQHVVHVPPWAARICFTWPRLAVVQAHRRCGPIGPFSEAGRRLGQPRALRDRPRPKSSRPAGGAERLQHPGGRRPAGGPARSRVREPGRHGQRRRRGPGSHGTGASGFASGSVPKTSVIRSLPPTPSTMQ